MEILKGLLQNWVVLIVLFLTVAYYLIWSRTHTNKQCLSEGGKKEETNEEPEDTEETESNCYIKLSGLPWKSTAEEIAKFLEDCNIVGNVLIINNEQGRPSGDALVKLKGKQDLQKAFRHNKKL